jgi:putative DNA primase/helicase
MMPEIKTQCAGRWTSVLVNIGIDEKYLNGKHGPCPICSGKDRWRWDRKKEMAFCSGCGHKGPMDLAIAFTGHSFKETAEEIRKLIGACKMEAVKPQDETEKNRARIERIRSGLKPINGECAASRYLANRGIRVLPDKDCYFHSGVDYWHDGVKSVHPAMVSIFRNLEGKGATMHITYLTPDGKKANVEAPKKILPVILPLTGCAIQLFKPVDGVLAVAEGIETALAAYQMDALPVWACGNAANMENLQIPEQIAEVVIYADEDTNFTGQKSAYVLANRLAAKGKAVRVMRLFDRKPFADMGEKYDFLDYCILEQHHQSVENARKLQAG